jgi:hypothetical protein
MAAEQETLLAKLSPIPDDVAKDFFRRLGVSQASKFETAQAALSGFRSFALTSEGSAVRTWLLRVQPSSEADQALYIHIEDPILPLGLAICKPASGMFLAYYTTSSAFKDKLGL